MARTRRTKKQMEIGKKVDTTEKKIDASADILKDAKNDETKLKKRESPSVHCRDKSFLQKKYQALNFAGLTEMQTDLTRY